MTKKALNVEAIGRNDFKIKETSDHTLLFAFELETDVEQVLETEPWSFNKHMVIFHRYDFSIPTRKLRFTSTNFGIQMHGLPVSMFDPETTIEIGEMIGTSLHPII